MVKDDNNEDDEDVNNYGSCMDQDLQSSVGVVPFNQVLRVYLSTLIKCRGR